AIDNPTYYTEVVFCGYGEPTLRLKVLLEVAKFIKQHGGQVRVNTDGLADLVHKGKALPALGQWVDALSVSLNAQTEDIYNRHCCPQLPGAYQAVLKFLAQAPKFIPSITATAISGLPGVDIQACQQLATSLGVKFRQRTLDVVG
ncbi:radical SAM protein, partial [Achromatium sp. WMS2]